MKIIKLHKVQFVLYFVSLMLLLSSNVFAAHWPEPEGSKNWLHLAGLEFTIYGSDAEIDDEVAVFDSGDQLVGHFTVTTAGMYGDMTIWVDSTQPAAIDDGCSPGTDLSICVWDESADMEYCGDDIVLVIPTECNDVWCPPVSLPLSCTGDIFNLLNISAFDADIDGVPDDLDLCADTPAGMEVDTNGCSECQRDNDDDGILNCDDNCIDTYNPDQTDSDSDGYGEVCDCNDNNLSVNPDAIEGPDISDATCQDGIDNDCDGSIDDADTGCPIAPSPDIAVSDPVAPVDDRQLPFGDITEGNSTEQIITIKNDGSANLDIGNIAQSDPLSEPFSILNDNCSGQSLSSSTSCTFTVRFAPTVAGEVNESFDIPSNDPDDNFLTISISGTGLSSYSNNPPSIPQLVFPAPGQTLLGDIVEFEWKETIDPDGDIVTYDLIVCTNENFTEGCETYENIASLNKDKIYFAGSGIGLLLFGVVLAGDIRGNKRKMLLLLAMIIIIAVYSASCGSGPKSDPSPPPIDKVTVTGTVLDKFGNVIEGADVTISSDPQTVTTDGSGNFSAEVEAGNHEIEIKNGSKEIWSGSCDSNETCSLGNIETPYGPPRSEIVLQEVVGLTVGTTYYWKIVADDGNGGVSESEVRSFTTTS